MSTSETENTEMALVPLDDAETGAPSAALLAVYADLPSVVVATVEYQRNAITRGVLEHLRTIRDALAPYGKFKDWCEATGLNYSAISHRLTRRDRAEQAAVVQTYAEGLPEPTPAEQHDTGETHLSVSDDWDRGLTADSAFLAEWNALPQRVLVERAAFVLTWIPSLAEAVMQGALPLSSAYRHAVAQREQRVQEGQRHGMTAEQWWAFVQAFPVGDLSEADWCASVQARLAGDAPEA